MWGILVACLHLLKMTRKSKFDIVEFSKKQVKNSNFTVFFSVGSHEVPGGTGFITGHLPELLHLWGPVRQR